MSERYIAYVYMNADAAASQRGYQEGDQLAFDDRTVLRIRATSGTDALEQALAIANGLGSDAKEKAWSPEVRSIGAGDVFHICRLDVCDPEDGGAFVMTDNGWNRLPTWPKATRGEEAMLAAGASRT